MGCRLTTTREEKGGGATIHSATASSPASEPTRKDLATSPQTAYSATEPAPKPLDAVTSPAPLKDDPVLSLPSVSSSCDYSPYYDPLQAEPAEASPRKDKSPKEAESPKKSKKRKITRQLSTEQTEAFSDTSSRYSMSVERQRERQEAADSFDSNASFNNELGGTIRSASSSVSRKGDAILDQGRSLSASHLVSNHPQTSDPIALLLSPRQRTVSIAGQALSGDRAAAANTAKKSSGPAATHANGNHKKRLRTTVRQEGDDELVLACMDCGMEISDEKMVRICPLTSKLHF